MIITVQQIVNEIRGLSGLRRNNYFSDVEISEFVADGGRELADIFIASYEHHFQTSADFTLAGGVGGNTFTLPDDFQKENMLLLNPTLDAPEQVPFLGSQLERAAMGPGIFLWPGGGRRALIADQTLEVLPPSMAAGAYRLLYTPQFSSMAFPRAPDFTVPVAAITGTAGSDFTMVPNGTPEPGTTWTATTNNPWIVDGVAMAGLSPPYILLSQRTNPAENGVFLVFGVGGGTASLQRLTSIPGHAAPFLPAKGQTTRVTGGTLGPGYYVQTNTPAVLDTSPITIAPMALPASLVPWVRYLKVYAALTVRRGRQQPAADLDRELTMLKLRASKMAANRTEQPKQAPITRGRRPWWGMGSGGWR